MNLRFGILILLGMLGSVPLRAQQNWLWAESGGGKKQDQSSSIAADSAGNIYVTGYYQDSAVFFDTNISSSKGSHFFLAKYSPAGSLYWIRTSSLTGHSAGTGICVSGNFLYLTGYFSDSLLIGNSRLFSASGTSNLFLAKYDLDGMALWAMGAAASGPDLRKAIVSDRQGNAYVCGSFSNSANFGGVSLSDPGNDDSYVVKYDPDGNPQWAKGFGSHSTHNAALGITLDHSQNIILTGSYGDTVTFGTSKLVSKASSDIFVAKLTSDGSVLWARQADGIDIGEGAGVVTDANENIYAAGSFSGKGGPAGCDGIGNIYVAKYTHDGVLQWMKCEGSGGEESANAIAIDSSGSIYVTGGYDFTVDFGTGPNKNNGLIDAFIVKYDPSGAAQWADHVGAAGTDLGTSVATDRNGNIVLTGAFSDTTVFGNFSLKSKGLTDIYIAKIGAQTSVHPLQVQTNTIAVYPNPVKKQLNIEYVPDPTGEMISIEVLNLLGISMKKITAPYSGTGKQSISIPVGTLPKGVYICRILSGGNTNSILIVAGDQ